MCSNKRMTLLLTPYKLLLSIVSKCVVFFGQYECWWHSLFDKVNVNKSNVKSNSFLMNKTIFHYDLFCFNFQDG